MASGVAELDLPGTGLVVAGRGAVVALPVLGAGAGAPNMPGRCGVCCDDLVLAQALINKTAVRLMRVRQGASEDNIDMGCECSEQSVRCKGQL